MLIVNIIANCLTLLSGRIMRGSSYQSVQGHAVWTSASATCSLHVTVFPLVAAYTARLGFHPFAYADASQGVGSLVGREFAQSLGARLLVSVFARDGSHS